MASPQSPVFSLAITDPKWVRAYVSEPDLGKIHPGMTATVGVDSFPKRRLRWLDRFYFTGRGVYTQSGADRGAAHQFGLRSARVRQGS